MKKIILISTIALLAMPAFAVMSETMTDSAAQGYVMTTASKLTGQLAPGYLAEDIGVSYITMFGGESDFDQYNKTKPNSYTRNSFSATIKDFSLQNKGVSRNKSLENFKGPQRLKDLNLLGKYNEENDYLCQMRSQLNYNAVPVPGALLLSGLGIGCISLFRRRRSI